MLLHEVRDDGEAFIGEFRQRRFRPEQQIGFVRERVCGQGESWLKRLVFSLVSQIIVCGTAG
jgi:hypothetical protein